ncbi:MAG: Rieske 2Fe-2S domain-containing protein [Planctomycetota bacterium]|nr:Rieske 2Fe-2S domain-containing protein [Planctomycetota bacterium]
MTGQWHLLTTVDQCTPGAAQELIVAGRVIALYCVDGEYHAMDGICPHQGGPLGKGTLNGCIVTCPWHGWQYNVVNGQHETTPLRHPTLPVRIEGDQVMVCLPDD